jgi:hypothetical protein
MSTPSTQNSEALPLHVSKWNQLEKSATALSSLIFLAGVGLFAYTGTFARLWADDYCYSAVTGQGGLWGGVAEWYMHSGNRFSSAAAVAISDWFGPAIVGLLPAAFLVLQTGAWIFFLFQVRRLLNWRTSGYWLVLFALVQVYFLTLLAPDRLQTIYWRMGMFHYSLPLPLLLIQLGLVARWASGAALPRFWLLLLAAFLALFAGGNSETFAFLQLGLWGLILAAVLVFLHGQRRMHTALLLLAPLVGSLLALVIMFFSPQNADRLAVMPPPDNLWLVIPVTLRHVGDFVFYAIRGQLTPMLVFVLCAAAVSLLSLRAGNALLSVRAALLALALSLLVMLALIAASFFPSSYAGLQYPSGRALMPAAFALLAGIGAAVFFAAHALQCLMRPAHLRWLTLAALVLLLAASLYPFRAASVQMQDVDRLSAWAQRWDDRDQHIRQNLAAGNLDIQAREVEVVWSLEDMGPEPDFWINRCAAVYYGAHTITANP